MVGDKRFGSTKRGKSHGLIFAFSCLAMLAGGCSKSEPEKSEKADKSEKAEKADNRALDTSRLPRVAGAKETFASAATTIFTSPDPVAQTADAVDKALAAGGWQKYVAPFTSNAENPTSRIMSLKKGTQALNVFITMAPAQANATSVQYVAVALKTDLPFPKDASNTEYSPDRPLLTAITAEPIDKTLDFYRKELAIRGWSLWSYKLNAKQPAGGPSGVVHRHGAYAHYVNDKEPTVALVLTEQYADAGKIKVELKEWPIGILKSGMPQPNSGRADVSRLPRLEGAKEDVAHTSSTRLSYTVLGSFENTVAATKKMLAADGWKQYASPSEEPNRFGMDLKKESQGLSVFFTMPPGEPVHSGVDFSAQWVSADLPFPDDAADIVFDSYRPYLNCVTAGTVDATLDFYEKELGAAGWVPLSASEAAAQWPNAKLDGHAYYIRERQKPILLSLQRRDDGKTSVEIKVAPFAEMQDLEAGQDDFGLPVPKRSKSSGGTGGQTQREAHALVPAEVSTVLAFYRRELAARHWKEETQGAVLKPEEVELHFTSVEGTAVLKLGHKYDLTSASLVQQVAKPTAPVRPVNDAKPAAKADSADAIMQQAEQLMRNATADALASMKSPKVAQAATGPEPALHGLSENKAPVPVPDTAEDVEFDGADGKLEFSSTSSLKSVADFYRSAMKEQGWASRSSVINNANMVVLNFAKAGKAVSFTMMKMGNKTNVTVDGTGLKMAAAKSDVPPAPADAAQAPAAADTANAPATADDLEAEESGGLPMPKRHTMSEGSKSPFRRELKASVPLALSDVLGFYRRELGKLSWKEESKGAVVAADNAAIAYTSPDGPAMLKLGRKDGATTVNLVVRNPGAAVKAGMMPKPGQAKLAFVNPNEVEAAVTINKQTFKVVAGGGTKGPDGQLFDLPPGKYKFSIKLAGKPASNDEIEVGADQAWGLLIGPGGALPMQVY
jgi:hypothetical protein